MSRHSATLIVATCILFLAQPCHAVGLTGNILQGGYDFPDLGTAYPDMSISQNPFTVGDGVETVISIEDVTFLSVDFDASSLLITLSTTLSNPTWSPTSQNGPVFTVVSGNPFSAISSVVASNEGPVSAFLSNGMLVLNWAGMSYQTGDTVRVDFSNVSAVPLPAAFPLFAGGLGGLGFLSWLRKREARAAMAT